MEPPNGGDVADGIGMAMGIGNDSVAGVGLPPAAARPSRASQQARPRSANNSPAADRGRERHHCQSHNASSCVSAVPKEDGGLVGVSAAAARLQQVLSSSSPVAREESCSAQQRRSTRSPVVTCGIIETSRCEGDDAELHDDDGGNAAEAMRGDGISPSKSRIAALSPLGTDPGIIRLQETHQAASSSAQDRSSGDCATSSGGDVSDSPSSSWGCSSCWAEVPKDVMSRVHHFTDIRSRRRIRLICSSWRTTFAEFFLELNPKILYPERLASCFPNTQRLVLSSTVPEQLSSSKGAVAPRGASSSLEPLSRLSSLMHIDFTTSPALLFFGLGIKATREDMMALSSLRNLRSLNLTGQCYGAAWDLGALTGLTGLTDLRVAGESTLSLSEAKSLAALTALELLDLSERCFERGTTLKHLSSLRRLRCLRLSKCYFARSPAAELAALAALPALLALDISGWRNVGDATVKHLCALTSLMHLNISQTPVQDSAIVKILSMPRLRSLDASYCPDLLGSGFSPTFIASSSSSLVYLDLCDPRKGGGGFQRMSPSQLGFGGGSALRAYHRPALAPRAGAAAAAESSRSSVASILGNNGADLERVRDAVDAVQAFSGPGLRFVSFRGCNRSTRIYMQKCHRDLPMLEHLATTLDPALSEDPRNARQLKGFQRLKCLRSLHIDSCVELASLGSEALGALSALTSLHMGRCIVPSTTTRHGAAPPPKLGLLTSLLTLTIDSCPSFTAKTLGSLAPCTDLRSLHLNTSGEAWVYMTTDAINALAPTFSRLSQLTINGCVSLSDGAIEALTNACTGLTGLNLSYSGKLRDNSLRFLARLPLLAHLELRACPRVSSGACAAAAALPALVSLDLSLCSSISDAGVASLGLSTTLRRINLHGCRSVTSDGFKTLPKWIYARC